MENDKLSVIVWFWRDLQTNTTRLRVVSVASGEEVLLNDGSFLLRISINANLSVTRCYCRHIGSGREAHMQGGPKLREFVKGCLLKSEAS